MADSIASELRRAFAVASMRKEAELLQKPEHWAEVRGIRTRAQDLTDTEKRLYHDRYDTRVEAARRRIIDQAGSRTRTFTPGWAGADRFDAADTLRQAHRTVRAAHEQRLGRIDAMELKALTSLVERSGRENARPQEFGITGPLGPDQNRRRSGPEQ